MVAQHHRRLVVVVDPQKLYRMARFPTNNATANTPMLANWLTDWLLPIIARTKLGRPRFLTPLDATVSFGTYRQSCAVAKTGKVCVLQKWFVRAVIWIAGAKQQQPFVMLQFVLGRFLFGASPPSTIFVISSA